MAFDRSKSHEVENGVVLNDGPGLFHDSPVPTLVGGEVEGDRYVDGVGRRWRFSSGAWVVDVNFAVRKVDSGESFEVKTNEQLLLMGPIVNLGEFKNFGETILTKIFEPAPAVPFPSLPDDNFSYFKISAAEEKTVPANQQMNVFGTIQNLGVLKVMGELNLTKIFQDDPAAAIVLPGDNFSHVDILGGETKTIPTRQQMTVVGPFRNLGQVNVMGSMVLISGAEPDYDDDYLPPWKIDVDQVFVVKSNRVLQVPRSFVNLGQLNNNGFVYLGG